MAERIGMRRDWFQPASSPHYDLSLSRRTAAVKAGAVEIDRKAVGALIKARRWAWVEEIVAVEPGRIGRCASCSSWLAGLYAARAGAPAGACPDMDAVSWRAGYAAHRPVAA